MVGAVWQDDEDPHQEDERHARHVLSDCDWRLDRARARGGGRAARFHDEDRSVLYARSPRDPRGVHKAATAAAGPGAAEAVSVAAKAIKALS